MEQSNDASKRDVFVWTEMVVITLCNFLNKYLERHGRTAPFKWSELQPQFEKIVKHKFQSDKALKNKHNSMKQDYNLWKSLKHGETGLGWNESTGKIECSSEWWAIKVKDNPNLTRFQRKQPSKEVQEAWEKLFGDVVASGVNCVAPSIEPSTLNEVPCTNLIDDDVDVDHNEDAYEVYTSYSSRLEELEKQQDDFFPTFIRDMEQPKNYENHTDNLNHTGGSKEPKKSSKVNDKPKHVLMKRKRESAGASKFKEYMNKQESTEQQILEILKSDTLHVNQDPSVNQASSFSVSEAISIINGMVNNGLMGKGELWCFAISLCEDKVKR